MYALNFLLATEAEWASANATPAPGAIAIPMETQEGPAVFILDHIENHGEHLSELWRTRPNIELLTHEEALAFIAANTIQPEV